jgi:hypothetical protein
MARILFERYPEAYKTLEEVEAEVNKARQQMWKEEEQP